MLQSRVSRVSRVIDPVGRRLDPVENIVPDHLWPGWSFTISNFERTDYSTWLVCVTDHAEARVEVKVVSNRCVHVLSSSLIVEVLFLEMEPPAKRQIHEEVPELS